MHLVSMLDPRRRLEVATGQGLSQLEAATPDHCHARRQHCWPVAEGSRGSARCRCSGRMPNASAWNDRLPWRRAARHGPAAA